MNSKHLKSLIYKGIKRPGKIPGYARCQIYKPFIHNKISYETEKSLLASEHVEWRDRPDQINFEHTRDTVAEPIYDSFVSGLYPDKDRLALSGSITYQPPDRFVKIWNNATILKLQRHDGDCDVIYFDQDGDIVGPLVDSTKERNKGTLTYNFLRSASQTNKLEFANISFGRSDKMEYKSVDTAICLATKTSMNYGHWLLENLPKLIKADQVLEKPPNVLINSPTKWQSETLDLLGVPNENRIVLENTPIIVKKFIQTDIKQVYSRDFDLCKEDLYKLSEKIKSNIQLNYKKERENIFVSRRHVERRFIKNIDEVIPILNNFGFKTIYPEEMSISEQIQQYHNAKAIIGPTGSGLANMIFSRDANIYPIIDNSWISGLFFALSQVVNHNCYPIYSRSGSIDLSKPYPYTNKSSHNIMVDIETLHHTLDNTLDV